MDKYYGHLIRNHIQRGAYKDYLDRLDGTNVLVFTDFKMKILYQKMQGTSTRLLRNYFGKRGNSDLGIVFVYKNTRESDLCVEYFDLFSEDSAQDWYFVCSAFETAFREFSQQTFSNINLISNF